MKKRFLLLLPLLLAFCSNEDIKVYNEPFEEYYAGYSSKEIEIPEGETLYIAGYHQAEEIQGVLDKQKACALTINDAIFISIDSVGISNYFVKQIREKLTDYSTNVHVFSTHDHAGIDTLGLWGGICVDGKNDKFMNNLIDASVNAAIESFQNKKKSKLYFGYNDTEDLQYDSREPIVFDSNVYQFRFEAEDGNGIRLINYAAHAESLRGTNYQVSADYVGKMRDLIKDKTNDDVIFIQGAIGGLIMTKELVDPFDPVANMILTAERLTNYILGISNEVLVDTKLIIARKQFEAKLDNNVFMVYKALGIIDNEVISGDGDTGYNLISELSIMVLGDILIYLIPGEIFPELVYGEVKEGDPNSLVSLANEYGYSKVLIFGLANDELGYVVAPSNFSLYEKAPYILTEKDETGENHYEETNSTSPDMAFSLYKNYEKLLKKIS